MTIVTCLHCHFFISTTVHLDLTSNILLLGYSAHQKSWSVQCSHTIFYYLLSLIFNKLGITLTQPKHIYFIVL